MLSPSRNKSHAPWDRSWHWSTRPSIEELAEQDVVGRLAPVQAVDELPKQQERRDAFQLVLRLWPLRLLFVVEVHVNEWAVPQGIVRFLVYEALLRKLPELAHDGNEADSGFELVLEPLLLAEQFGIPHPLETKPFAVLGKSGVTLVPQLFEIILQLFQNVLEIEVALVVEIVHLQQVLLMNRLFNFCGPFDSLVLILGKIFDP